MPHCHFTIKDGGSISDHEGAEFADWKAARLNAIAVASRILADNLERVALGESWYMEVADDGLVLLPPDFCVTAASAVRKPLTSLGVR